MAANIVFNISNQYMKPVKVLRITLQWTNAPPTPSEMFHATTVRKETGHTFMNQLA